MFNVIKTSESVGKTVCTVNASNIGKNILKVMQEHKYIGSFEFIDDGKGGKFKIELVGRINSCNSIKPRFSTQVGEYIKWEKRFLPAQDVGILLVSTSKGVMDQYKARKMNEGGKLLGFVY